jgi:hypothetical protein
MILAQKTLLDFELPTMICEACSSPQSEVLARKSKEQRHE